MSRRLLVGMVAILPIAGWADAITLGEPMRFEATACANPRVICDTPSAKPTSVVALLGNPDAWENKAVGVWGFVFYDMHGTLLYMSTEHCRLGNQQYGVQIDSDRLESVAKELTARRCHSAYVEGIYHPHKQYEIEPGMLTIRDRPGLIELRYLAVEDHDT